MNLSISKFIFLQGKLSQWEKFEHKKFTIWIAGINKKEKFIKLKNILFDEPNIKKILNIFGNHFGLTILSKNFIFAVSDYSRSYPIFWKLDQDKLLLSPQANLLKSKLDKINQNQLQAFRMSGYTINHETLWYNINNLKNSSYLLCRKYNKPLIKQYFVYQPWKIKNYSLLKFSKILKIEINKLFLNIIKEAQGRKIIIPLSAGLDSRLIISGLHKFNYKNVKCFSYGLKDNFESVTAKKIAKKLGYEYEFVQINYKKAKYFFKSAAFKKYLNFTNDGMSVPTIHSLYALDHLIKNKFIKKNDIIINGNSGDFISGGHIPKTMKYKHSKSQDIKSLFNNIFNDHYSKHYSLWKSLKNKYNKKIIKEALYNQLHSTVKVKKNLTEYGILEFLEYENRQTKYVVNCQRIYDYHKLDWLLPLWNMSFIRFWQTVPLQYKLDQFLYKKVLYELNFGDVWNDNYNSKPYISPNWIRLPRFLIKAFFLFQNKEKWYEFERRYILYWTDIICSSCINPYFKTIKNRNGFRHAVSWLALKMEKLNIGKKWN